MQGAYYLIMLFGIVWVCIWSVLPEEQIKRGWWPFSMREADGDREPGGRAGDANSDASGRWRNRVRSGKTAPADVQHPVPERGTTQSRRIRAEPAAPPRRQRPR